MTSDQVSVLHRELCICMCDVVYLLQSVYQYMHNYVNGIQVQRIKKSHKRINGEISDPSGENKTEYNYGCVPCLQADMKRCVCLCVCVHLVDVQSV